MHTTEQAKQLWCPMARVAQAGNVDISTSYNRTINRTLRVAKAATVQSPDEFELGTKVMPDFESITIMEATSSTSMAAACLASKCAAWRWLPEVRFDPKTDTLVMPGLCGMIPAKGYCGLAGAPATQS